MMQVIIIQVDFNALWFFKFLHLGTKFFENPDSFKIILEFLPCRPDSADGGSEKKKPGGASLVFQYLGD